MTSLNATAMETASLEAFDHHWYGICLEIIFLVYCFAGLATVCDDFLVPSLESICVRWNIREDVAGASFMAFGSAAPEIIVNAISTLKASGQSPQSINLGLGAILGSSVIAFSLIPGCCVLLCEPGTVLELKRRPLIRDIATYVVALSMLVHSIKDGNIDLNESALLLVIYVVYLLVVFFAPTVRSKYRVHVLRESLLPRQSFVERARETEGTPDVYLLEDSQPMYDGTGAAVIDSGALEESSSSIQIAGPDFSPSDLIPQETPNSFGAKVFGLASKTLEPLRWIVRKTCPENEDLHMVAFFVSFLWVSLFSFCISTVVERWGVLSQVPLAFFGFFLVSLGAEVPDTVQSVTVARRGYGSMAISNAMGSQICNICIGLGLPWLLSLLGGSTIAFSDAKFLFLAIYLQFGSITIFTVLLFASVVWERAEKATLDRRKGMILVLVYITVVSVFALSTIHSQNSPLPGSL